MQSTSSLARAGFPCQEQDLLGKSRVSLARAMFLWQEQSFLGKSKVSLARAEFPWQEQDLVEICQYRIYLDTRIAGTQVLQGNLDTTGEIFDKIVASLKAGETEHIWQKYNSQESPWAVSYTHLTLPTILLV